MPPFVATLSGQSLQWGRGFVAAETLEKAREAAELLGFNGAAAL